MKFHRLPVFLLLVALVAVFSGCKEPSDEIWPEITVIQPENNLHYSPGDTIILKANFSDDVSLHYVKVSLVDADNIPVLAPVSVMPVTNPFSLDAEMIIDDASLKGGAYNLQFQTSDGVNVTNKYVRLYIDEPEREFLFPVIFSSSGNSQVRIQRVDTAGVFRTIFLYQGDYAASDISQAFRMLYFSGRSSGDLLAFSLSENKSLWSVPCKQSPSGHWFETLRYSYPWLLVSQYDGFVRGYDRYGVQQFKSQEVANNYACNVTLISDYVLASMRDYSNANYQLALFHVSGGKLMDLLPVGFVPVDFANAGSNKVLVFGNQGSDGVIALYDIVSSNISVINRIRGKNINDMDVMSDKVYYFSARDEIFQYAYTSNSIIPFASGYANARVACENIGRKIYIASGNYLYVLNAWDGSADTSWHFEEPVLDVHLVYNK